MIEVSLSTDKPEYQTGETIEVIITVDGASTAGSREVQVTASVVVDGTTYSVDAPVTVTWAGSDVAVESVTAEGIDFAPTSDPLVWTGVAA